MKSQKKIYVDGIVCDAHTPEPPQVPAMVDVYSCDCCGREFPPDELFDVDEDMMCLECAEENFSVRELMEALYGTVQE